MTIQIQQIQPLLNWVNSLIYKLSTITNELFLQNEPKIEVQRRSRYTSGNETNPNCLLCGYVAQQ